MRLFAFALVMMTSLNGFAMSQMDYAQCKDNAALASTMKKLSETISGDNFLLLPLVNKMMVKVDALGKESSTCDEWNAKLTPYLEKLTAAKADVQAAVKRFEQAAE